VHTDRVNQIKQMMKFKTFKAAKLGLQELSLKSSKIAQPEPQTPKPNPLLQKFQKTSISDTKNSTPAPTAKNPTMRLRKLQLFLLSQRVTSSNTYQGILLMLQMFYLFENIRNFRKTLLIFYKKADTILQKYDLYHSLKLFEFGLMSYYTQNEALTGEKLCPKLTDLIQSIYLTSQKNDTESYLNINIILQSEKEFNLLINLMSNVVGRQNELFWRIRREKKMEMIELHGINRELLGVDRRILGIYMN
jgi:hypothetical protein